MPTRKNRPYPSSYYGQAHEAISSAVMAEVIGVYEVPEAPEACHLIEMVLPSGSDVGEITQADPAQPRANWQVPWDERTVERLGDNERVVFFLHYLDLTAPLTTPWGEIEVPKPSARPARLADVEYEEP